MASHQRDSKRSEARERPAGGLAIFVPDLSSHARFVRRLENPRIRSAHGRAHDSLLHVAIISEMLVNLSNIWSNSMFNDQQ